MPFGQLMVSAPSDNLKPKFAKMKLTNAFLSKTSRNLQIQQLSHYDTDICLPPPASIQKYEGHEESSACITSVSLGFSGQTALADVFQSTLIWQSKIARIYLLLAIVSTCLPLTLSQSGTSHFFPALSFLT